MLDSFLDLMRLACWSLEHFALSIAGCLHSPGGPSSCQTVEADD